MTDGAGVAVDKSDQVVPKLRLALKSLSQGEQLVLQHCIERGSKIYEDDIKTLAGRCGVSSALVVKVAKRCGFKGYRELRAALAVYAAQNRNDLHKELDPRDDVQTVINKVFSTSILTLQETMQILDPEELKRVADHLVDADQIIFIGVGGSGALALDAFHKFLRIGARVQLLTDSHMMVMAASLLTRRSVLFGFSHSGRTGAVVEAFKLAKRQNATTIAITNTLESQRARHSDHVLCSVAQGSPINGENAAARIALLNILDIIFVLYAQFGYELSLDNLARTIDSVANLRA
jgi:DNA-binding MurR/RpiR family transcriptional regulator